MSGRRCIDCGAPISEISRGRCVDCGHRPLIRNCPPDFLDVLGRLGSRLAAAHYRASLKTITRWRREHGLPPNHRARRTSGSTGRLNRARFGMNSKPIMIRRDLSPAGRAADFLQRFGPIFACTPQGKALSGGNFWNRNGHVLSADEVIQRAERLGWERPRDF